MAGTGIHASPCHTLAGRLGQVTEALESPPCARLTPGLLRGENRPSLASLRLRLRWARQSPGVTQATPALQTRKPWDGTGEAGWGWAKIKAVSSAGSCRLSLSVPWRFQIVLMSSNRNNLSPPLNSSARIKVLPGNLTLPCYQLRYFD